MRSCQGEGLTAPACSACEQFACFFCEASLFGREPCQATDTPPLNRRHEVLLPEPGMFIGKGAEVCSSPVLSQQPGGLAWAASGGKWDSHRAVPGSRARSHAWKRACTQYGRAAPARVPSAICAFN